MVLLKSLHSFSSARGRNSGAQSLRQELGGKKAVRCAGFSAWQRGTLPPWIWTGREAAPGAHPSFPSPFQAPSPSSSWFCMGRDPTCPTSPTSLRPAAAKPWSPTRPAWVSPKGKLPMGCLAQCSTLGGGPCPGPGLVFTACWQKGGSGPALSQDRLDLMGASFAPSPTPSEGRRSPALVAGSSVCPLGPTTLCCSLHVPFGGLVSQEAVSNPPPSCGPRVAL